MKNIDKKLIKAYHDRNKETLKDRLDLVDGQIDTSVLVKKFYFSFHTLSLVLSALILVLSVFFFINSNTPNNSQIPLSNAEKHLSTSTIDYIDSPVETLLFEDDHIIVSIYYGVDGVIGETLEHYMLFEVISDIPTTVETTVTSNDLSIYQNTFAYLHKDNNYYDFLFDENSISVSIIINGQTRNVDLELTPYYDFLTK